MGVDLPELDKTENDIRFIDVPFEYGFITRLFFANLRPDLLVSSDQIFKHAQLQAGEIIKLKLVNETEYNKLLQTNKMRPHAANAIQMLESHLSTTENIFNFS